MNRLRVKKLLLLLQLLFFFLTTTDYHGVTPVVFCFFLLLLPLLLLLHAATSILYSYRRLSFLYSLLHSHKSPSYTFCLSVLVVVVVLPPHVVPSLIFFIRNNMLLDASYEMMSRWKRSIFDKIVVILFRRYVQKFGVFPVETG